MARGQPVYDGVSSLSSGNEWKIDSGGNVPDKSLIYSVFAGESCDLFWEYDAGKDGTYEVSVKVASISKDTAYQDKDLVLDFPYTRLRLKNTGNSSADFGVCGYVI